jgi:cytoskeletal protein RodZ
MQIKFFKQQSYLLALGLITSLIFIAFTVSAQINEETTPDTAPQVPEISNENLPATEEVTMPSLPSKESLDTVATTTDTEVSNPEYNEAISSEVVPDTEPVAPNMLTVPTDTEGAETTEPAVSLPLLLPEPSTPDVARTAVESETLDDAWYPIDIRDCRSPEAREYFRHPGECMRMMHGRY